VNIFKSVVEERGQGKGLGERNKDLGKDGTFGGKESATLAGAISEVKIVLGSSRGRGVRGYKKVGIIPVPAPENEVIGKEKVSTKKGQGSSRDSDNAVGVEEGSRPVRIDSVKKGCKRGKKRKNLQKKRGTSSQTVVQGAGRVAK